MEILKPTLFSVKRVFWKEMNTASSHFSMDVSFQYSNALKQVDDRSEQSYRLSPTFYVLGTMGKLEVVSVIRKSKNV